MSILDGPTEPPKHMPSKLKAVLVFYVLSMGIDLWVLTQDTTATRTWVRLVIGVLVIAFLLRGSDSVRAIVRGFAALGIVFGAVIVLQALSLGVGTTLGLIALLTGAFAFGSNVFTFWALGQDDVQLWMATRTFKRVA
jgi:hypothetical protein